MQYNKSDLIINNVPRRLLSFLIFLPKQNTAVRIARHKHFPIEFPAKIKVRKILFFYLLNKIIIFIK